MKASKSETVKVKEKETDIAKKHIETDKEKYRQTGLSYTDMGKQKERKTQSANHKYKKID